MGSGALGRLDEPDDGLEVASGVQGPPVLSGFQVTQRKGAILWCPGETSAELLQTVDKRVWIPNQMLSKLY